MLHSIEWRLPALGRAAELEIVSRMFVKVTLSLLSTGSGFLNGSHGLKIISKMWNN